jgi:thioesterase domain-containing protein
METDPLLRLQAVLNADIPLSRAMGLAVTTWNDSCLTLYAPLAPNINHRETAFAGSLNAVLTLSGWSLIWLLLDQERIQGKIVIQDSQIAYLHPVESDFAARCCLPPTDQVDRFLAMMRRKGRARIELHATIEQNGQIAVNFVGRYVAVWQKSLQNSLNHP